MNNNIKIAIQKKGYLTDETIKYLQDKGLKFKIQDRNLIVNIINQNISLYLLRNSDIPILVEDGICDCGILGLDQVLEQQKKVKIIKRLGLSQCKLSIAIPNNSSINAINDLPGKTIATSYPNIVKKYFIQKKININIKILAGSVEIAPQIGLADGIADIVSTGCTLNQNNLTEIEKICDFEAVLISRINLESGKLQYIRAIFNL